MWAGQGDLTMAQRSYRNALAQSRGEVAQALSTAPAGTIDTRVIAIEERDAHGVPRLRE